MKNLSKDIKSARKNLKKALKNLEDICLQHAEISSQELLLAVMEYANKNPSANLLHAKSHSCAATTELELRFQSVAIQAEFLTNALLKEKTGDKWNQKEIKNNPKFGVKLESDIIELFQFYAPAIKPKNKNSNQRTLKKEIKPLTPIKNMKINRENLKTIIQEMETMTKTKIPKNFFDKATTPRTSAIMLNSLMLEQQQNTTI